MLIQAAKADSWRVVDNSEICRFRSYLRVDDPLLDLSRTRKVLVIPNRGSQVTQLFHYQTLVAST